MITLRPYKTEDAKIILSWIKNEKSFFLWCANRFNKYPISSDKFNNIYNTDELQGFIAEDDGKTIGHLFMQKLSDNRLKFGLIIVDSSIRRKGYGKSMLLQAIEYAKTNFNINTITLCVFDNNHSAYECYKKIGFAENGKYTEIEILGEMHKYFELEYKVK